MITEEKLHRIYDKITEKNILKTKELLEIGFKPNDLTILVNVKTLKRLKIGYYELTDVEKLFQYGKQYLCSGNVPKAQEIFEACSKIDPNHGGTLFQLFFRNIKEGNLEEAFNYLDRLLKVSNQEYYQIDYNVYLYLLNQLIELPQNYQNYVNYLQEEDLKVKSEDRRYKEQDRHNQVRRLIFTKNNSFALSKLNYCFSFTNQPQISIIRTLVVAILKKEKAISAKIIDLLKEENYQAIIELLQKEHVENLSQYMQKILDIAKDLLEIEKTKIAIESSFETSSTIIAIDRKNYELALCLRSKYNAYTKVSNESDALYLILKAITLKNEEVKFKSDDNKQLTISELEESLFNKDIPNAIKCIKKFLVSIQKEEYEVLAILLLKLNLFRKTNNFKFVVNFLRGLIENKVELNIDDLIKEYELSFKNKNNEKARLLLEILQSLEKLGLASNVTSGLGIKAENNIEKKESKVPTLPVVEPQKEIIKPSLPKQIEINPEIKAFMENIYQKLEKDELIILSEEDSLKIDIEIFNKKYRKAHAFKIGTNGQVVIKTTKYVNPNKVYEYTKNGDEAFKNANWEEAIREYKELLFLRNTLTRVYANLGLAYMNLNNLVEAIKYLTIANGLSEINPLIKFDYHKLINELKAKLSSNIKKEQNYGIDNVNLNDYFGISKIKDVVLLIEFSGLTLEDACKGLLISSNDKNMIGLLLARDCYARGAFEVGDDYIRQVEESQYKSKKVLAFMASIKQNKLLYQTRVNEDYKPLTRARTLDDLY